MIIVKKLYYLSWVLLGCGLLAGLVILNYTYPLTLGKRNILYSDFGKFYHSQRLFIEKKDIYSPVYFIKNKKAHTTWFNTQLIYFQSIHQLAENLNPPFFTLLTFPLGYLSYPHALMAWTLLSIMAGTFSVLLLLKKMYPNVILPHYLLFLVAFFCYFPSFAALQFGQVTLFLLPLLVLGWRATRDEKKILAGVFLGLAASLKPFLGLFLIYFLTRREWKGLFSFILTGLFCLLLTFLFFGLSTYISYYRAFKLITWAASNWNVSFYGFLLRLIGGPENNTSLFHFPHFLHTLYYLLSLSLLLLITWFLWPKKPNYTQAKTDLDFCIIIIAMLLLSPLGWLYYFPFLSIPFFVLGKLSREGIYPIGLPLIIGTLVFLSNIPVPLIPSNEINSNNQLSVFLSSNIYFGVLIILTGLLFLVRRHLVLGIPLSFEKIPSTLLLLMGVVVFLPSLIGITKASHVWMCYGAYYSKEYTLFP